MLWVHLPMLRPLRLLLPFRLLLLLPPWLASLTLLHALLRPLLLLLLRRVLPMLLLFLLLCRSRRLRRNCAAAG